MPSTTLKTNLGAILIGTLVNLSLYTLEITQVIAYFTSERRKRDRLWIKLCVLFNLLADTIASFASWAGIFIYSVLNWGHFEDLQHNIWPLVVVILVDGLVTFVVQSFMVYRYWKMSANHVLTALIALCMLTTLGGTFRTGISSAIEPSLAERRDHLQTSIISFGGNCITDLSITFALLYQLHRSVHSAFTRNTQDILWRVTFMVITTGCVPSVFTTAGVVLLAVEPKTYLATAVAFMYGRMYALTMLYTLNLRDRIRGDSLVKTVDVVSSRFHHSTSRTRGGSDASDATFAHKVCFLTSI
ncbi:hypothetical protein BDQ17DRAFT_1071778 [Cyathus striatus]|nr:hypothetical protein BDQ17DRAFT_1071778 [Cyathus striatus]